MAISKRLRFEIFRRDNHTCRYCGRSAPEVKLTVDHVIPTALGGRDEPANLVTACSECNSGKSATPPDAPLVNDVAQDALRWSQAMLAASIAREHVRDVRQAYRDEFQATWSTWTYGPDKEPVPLPRDWTDSIDAFYRADLPVEEIYEAVRVAMVKDAVLPANTFRYFCGVCWRALDEMRELAAHCLSVTEATSGS